MFGVEFFKRQFLVHGCWPKSKIKDWQIVRVYICSTCGCARLFWVDEMCSSDHISCRAKTCTGTMTLMSVPMEQAKTIPNVQERINFATARGF